MNTTTQTRSTKIVCLSNGFRQWRLHTLSLPIGKPDAAPGEGSVFTLSGFDVSRKNPKFRLSDALLSIWFNDGTSFEKRAMTVRTIPTEMFRFPSYDQLPELANTGKQLPGMDTSVCVSMFDSLALAFHSKFDSYGREPRIFAIVIDICSCQHTSVSEVSRLKQIALKETTNDDDELDDLIDQFGEVNM
ncbi:BnaA08g04260D [Brassica napus]|uniref:BnaA08g04260D protein n=1 Tax=Brassica napus TaxID=3708 RepID=A0A078FWH7_BRANA|nr:BnaA08g04260D [Brassica napus]